MHNLSDNPIRAAADPPADAAVRLLLDERRAELMEVAGGRLGLPERPLVRTNPGRVRT